MATRWRPDTCDCVILADPPAPLTAERLCPHHATPDAARADNKLKNDAIKAVADTTGEPAMAVSWRYDAARRVIVTSSLGLTGARKAAVLVALAAVDPTRIVLG
jgi:hypothetical protein